jgi:hypothetical protein
MAMATEQTVPGIHQKDDQAVAPVRAPSGDVVAVRSPVLTANGVTSVPSQVAAIVQSAFCYPAPTFAGTVLVSMGCSVAFSERNAARLPKAPQSDGDYAPVGHAVGATCHRRPVSTSVITEKIVKIFARVCMGERGEIP